MVLAVDTQYTIASLFNLIYDCWENGILKPMMSALSACQWRSFSTKLSLLTLTHSQQLTAETSFKKPSICLGLMTRSLGTWRLVPPLLGYCNNLQGCSSTSMPPPSRCPNQTPCFRPTQGGRAGAEGTSTCCQMLMPFCR